MFYLVGLVIIAISIFIFLDNRIYQNKLKDHKKNPSYQDMPKDPFIKTTKWWIITIFGIFVMFLSGAFFYADSGTAYAVQYPWGGDKIVRTQGVKAKWWGRVIPLSYEISIKYVKPNSEGEIPENERGIINIPAKYWEFSDAIKAKIETAVIVKINIEDEDTFLKMADLNRSENKLVYGRIIPNIDGAIKNTAKLMDAQEYISGKAAEFDRLFRDQLNNGVYRIEEYYDEDNDPVEIIGDTSTVRKIKSANTKTKKYRIKEKDGFPLRDTGSNSLTQYGISFAQAQVTSIDWEESFDKRLQLQKEQVAQTQLEKQETEKEYYRQEKERVKGESEKVKERAKLEKEQIQITIAAETKAKAAKFKEEEEKNLLAAANKEATRIKVLADAEAYKNQRLVSAGLTPQERAEYDLKMVDVVSKNLSGMNVPNNIVTGGKDSNPTEALLQVKLLRDILKN